MRKRNHSDFISWFETEQEVFVWIKVLDTFHEQCQHTIQIISHSINVTKRERQENKACSFYISNEQLARPSLRIIIKKMQVIALVSNFKPNFQSYYRAVTIKVKHVQRQAWIGTLFKQHRQRHNAFTTNIF